MNGDKKEETNKNGKYKNEKLIQTINKNFNSSTLIEK